MEKEIDWNQARGGDLKFIYHDDNYIIAAHDDAVILTISRRGGGHAHRGRCLLKRGLEKAGIFHRYVGQGDKICGIYGSLADRYSRLAPERFMRDERESSIKRLQFINGRANDNWYRVIAGHGRPLESSGAWDTPRGKSVVNRRRPRRDLIIGPDEEPAYPVSSCNSYATGVIDR